MYRHRGPKIGGGEMISGEESIDGPLDSTCFAWVDQHVTSAAYCSMVFLFDVTSHIIIIHHTKAQGADAKRECDLRSQSLPTTGGTSGR